MTGVRACLLLAAGIVITAGCSNKTATSTSASTQSAGSTTGSNGSNGSASTASSATGSNGSSTSTAGGSTGSNGSSASASTSSGTSASSSTNSSGSSGSSGAGLTISPASITLVVNGSQYFACSEGGSVQTCTWSVAESNGGTINAAGLYVAPNAAGTFHVVAQSQTTAQSARATVTVTAQVGGCNNLAAIGTWENITPPQIDYANWCIPGSSSCTSTQLGTYGTNQFALDPNHPGTIYLGTAGLGMWKSTDCGSTWTKLDTGQNSTALDSGRQNCLYVDPTNSDILYTMALYDGTVEGFYQSLNGGVDWTQVVTPDALNTAAGGFFQGVSIDPTDPTHFVAYPHQNCGGTPLPGAAVAADGTWGCLAEGYYTNGSWTWSITTSPFPPGQGDGIVLTLLGPKTWLEGSLFRTTTGGVPPADGGPASAWTQVYPAPGQTAYVGGCYLSSIGVIYCGQAQQPLIYSTDNGVTWSTSTSISAVSGITDDGTTLYVSTGSNGDSYFTTPISPAQPVGTFTPMTQNPPGAVWGGFAMQYDRNFNVLYSSNLTGGFWRVVTK